ncbi:MAG: DUF1476 domain-containing protein [Hyphomicrobiaceae bacterium]
MTTFDEREKAFEKKFAHDQEMQFKAQARRNKLLGLWAAGLMGLSSKEADDYAKSVVKADFEEPGEEDVVRKIRQDLNDKGVGRPDDDIRRMMAELLVKAKDQIMTEVKK